MIKARKVGMQIKIILKFNNKWFYSNKKNIISEA